MKIADWVTHVVSMSYGYVQSRDRNVNGLLLDVNFRMGHRNRSDCVLIIIPVVRLTRKSGRALVTNAYLRHSGALRRMRSPPTTFSTPFAHRTCETGGAPPYKPMIESDFDGQACD